MNLLNLFAKSRTEVQTSELDQQVINDNEEIHAAIIAELSSAKEEILIAAAWFTDHELFSVLEEKISSGIKIEVIMSENQENYRLPFDNLLPGGAVIRRVKNAGYGVMNQKFCIIDRSRVLHGSYNWSVNARKNNNESIIVTNHQPTVDSLVKTFYSIKEKSEEQVINQKSDVVELNDEKPSKPIKSVTDPDLAQVLDSMIAAEVAHFDRAALRQQGFDRAKANNGDHQVLLKSLDTVYSIFINDIDVIEDKKRRLLGKIEVQKLHALDAAKQEADLSIAHNQSEIDLRKKQLEATVTNNKATIGINDDEIANLNSKIKYEQDQIAKFTGHIKEEKLAFIRPTHRLFELIPLTCFVAMLLSYLFIFYSSAAYIMIYSTADAELNQLQGNLEVPEVFNPEALSLAGKKGVVALFFVISFVLVPIVLAVLPKIMRFKMWQESLTWVGILLVDAIIAYQVASVVHRINILRGDTTEPWAFTHIFSDSNFYLVFILGALGLILFKFIYAKLIGYFEERNPDHATLKSREQIKQYEFDIEQCNDKIIALRAEVSKHEQNTILLSAENQICQAEIEQGPSAHNSDRERILIGLNQQNQLIQQTSDLYVSHIENDNLPISLDSLKDRINIFLEGWNDFLHQEYAILKATDMSQLAAAQIDQWQQEKIVNKKIDYRVKL